MTLKALHLHDRGVHHIDAPNVHDDGDDVHDRALFNHDGGVHHIHAPRVHDARDADDRANLLVSVFEH